jgi:hypothetical protein
MSSQTQSRGGGWGLKTQNEAIAAWFWVCCVKWRWCVVDGGGGGVSQLKWWQLSASHLQMRAGGGGWSQNPQSEHKGSVSGMDMDCLGHQIDDQGLYADTDKMARVCKWHTLISYPEALQFIRLVKYLAHFMPNISAYTSPLESICSNGQPFQWRPLHQTCLD